MSWTVSSCVPSQAMTKVASDLRCKCATGVGSSGSYQLTKEDPRPWQHEYRPPRPSAPRSTSCCVRRGAAERHRAGRTTVGAPDLPACHRRDRLRGTRPRPQAAGGVRHLEAPRPVRGPPRRPVPGRVVLQDASQNQGRAGAGGLGIEVDGRPVFLGLAPGAAESTDAWRGDAAPVMTAVRSPGKGLSAFIGLLPSGRETGRFAQRPWQGER